MSTETVSSTTSPLSAVKYSAASDIGLRREENQDSFGIIENTNFKLYIVADGMGGVKGGGVASNLAINVLKECLEDKTELGAQAICAAVEHANSEIFEKGTGDASLAGMGTTYVGLGFVDTKLFISSVGDSRAYRIRDNNIIQLTTDHTLVQELLRSGAISAEQADNHPVSHMLTRSLGPSPSVDVDCWLCSDGPARGDIYVMCSDGLYNLVQSQEIATIVQDNYIDVAVQKLIKLANDRGGTDNITVIVVEVTDDYPVGPEAFEQPGAAHADGVSKDSITDTSTDVPGRVEQSESELVDTAENIEPIRFTHAPAGSASTKPAPLGVPVDLEPIADSATQNSVETPDSPRLQSRVSMASAQAALDATQTAEAGAVNTEASTEVAESASSPLSWLPLRSQPLPRPVILGGAFAFVTLIGFIGGFYAPRLLGKTATVSEQEVLAPQVPQAQIARVQPEVPVSQGGPRGVPPALRVGFQDIPSAGNSDSGGLGGDSLNNAHESGMAPEELSRISRRKAVLKQLVLELNDKIGAFDRPINAKLAESLKAAREQRESLEAEQDDFRSQIDVATRKLAVWYGRRKRLQSTDPINLASEVAVASPSVKEKKEIFELATWSYLKEAEVLRYNPSDNNQDKKVSDLAKVRKDRQHELADEVRKAIDKEVADSDKAIAELTFKRDKILAEIENIRRDEEYVKILMGSDPKAKETKRHEFMRERDIASAEFDELSRIVPESADSAALNTAGTDSTQRADPVAR